MLPNRFAAPSGLRFKFYSAAENAGVVQTCHAKRRALLQVSGRRIHEH
jgi:hypothetical protein